MATVAQARSPGSMKHLFRAAACRDAQRIMIALHGAARRLVLATAFEVLPVFGIFVVLLDTGEYATPIRDDVVRDPRSTQPC